jgi:hypothetical protein
MRWSERPPAARSRFTWLVHFHRGQRSLSVAVAHLVLVRSNVTESNFSVAWLDLKRRRRICWISWAAFFPAMFCVGVLSQVLHREWLFLVGGVIFFAWLFAVGIHALAFRCPRCGELFYFSFWPPTWRGFLGRECTHCGLPRFSNPPVEATQPI